MNIRVPLPEDYERIARCWSGSRELVTLISKAIGCGTRLNHDKTYFDQLLDSGFRAVCVCVFPEDTYEDALWSMLNLLVGMLIKPPVLWYAGSPLYDPPETIVQDPLFRRVIWNNNHHVVRAVRPSLCPLSLYESRYRRPRAPPRG